jgi:internalin A
VLRHLDLSDTEGLDADEVAAALAGARPWVRRLSIVHHGVTDLSGIRRLAGRLVELNLRTASSERLDLATFPQLRRYHGPWEHVGDSIGAGSRLETLMVEGYDATDLRPLASLPALRGVRLERPRRLVSLDGLGHEWDRFCALQASRLTDVSALSSAAHLRLLELTGCRPDGVVDLASRCDGLVELDLSGCHELPTLEPLRSLTDLRRLSLLGSTVVVDGDLQPLMDLPRLSWVSLEPRSHYRPTAAEIIAHGRAKRPYHRRSWWR